MVFGGGILGGARKIWGNPYLNSTTVLFDNNRQVAMLMCVILTYSFANAIPLSYCNLAAIHKYDHITVVHVCITHKMTTACYIHCL